MASISLAICTLEYTIATVWRIESLKKMQQLKYETNIFNFYSDGQFMQILFSTWTSVKTNIQFMKAKYFNEQFKSNVLLSIVAYTGSLFQACFCLQFIHGTVCHWILIIELRLSIWHDSIQIWIDFHQFQP